MVMRKSLVPMLAAVGLGLGAAFFAQQWMSSRIARVEAEQRNGVPVVVAVEEIHFGDRINSTQLKVVAWPHDSVPEGAFHEVTDVQGKMANQKILPGEPVLAGRASQNAGGSSLASLIEPQKRAVTVRVNDVIGVAGFLLPGNHVDVLATRMLENRRATTRTLLEDLKVLAVDQTAAPEKDKPTVVRAVTLEVGTRDAELLIQATEEGTVQLSLRNPDERETAPPPVAAADPPADVKKPAAAPPKKRQQARAARPEDSSVTVIRQTQVGENRPH
jgi:pilus assembly protein CpaB